MNSLVEEVIKKASQYIGLTEEKTNDATWLRALMQNNPAHWTPPLPYCISAAAACWDYVLRLHDLEWPFQVTPGTQLTFDNAQAKGFVSDSPARGDIVIYRDGQTAHGHAGIITSVMEGGLGVIEFNTSPLHTGNQREGEGCYLKQRSFASLQNPNGFHIRGYIQMSRLQALDAQTMTTSPDIA